MESVKKNIVVLDGGTGMTLKEMGHPNLDDDLMWSAALVKTHPEDIVRLHKQFFVSGADMVVTATYQASVDGYMKRFAITESEAIELIRKGIELAQQARDEAEKITGRRGFVAGSIGAYGAITADYAEYHGKYADTMTRQELCDWHLPRLRTVIEMKPDILAIETIPVVLEAEAVLDALLQVPHIDVYISFQCQDGNRTGHGEHIRDAVKAVTSHPACDRVVALGLNCCHPRFVTSLLREMKAAGVPIVIKPNGGRFESDDINKPSMIDLRDYVEEWINNGARWIGGCCHIFPDDIDKLRAKISTLSDCRFLGTNEKLVV